jgi:type IV pilus assembly protein PilV
MLVNKLHAGARRQGGFTLIELLITILIVTVGLLGLAKLQAAAVAESGMSRTRALMTFQAESLAGMMRANKPFWSTTAGPFPSFAVNAAGTRSNTSMTAPTTDCLSPQVCTPAQMAYYDMYTWAGAFNDGTAASSFLGATASITCVPSSGASCTANPAVPHSYDIVLTWKEKYVAINRSTVNAGANATPTATMVMHVQP